MPALTQPTYPAVYAASQRFPAAAKLVAPEPHCDFLACHRASLPVPLTALDAWNAVMARPLPLMGLAFKLRDAISSRFGVRKIGGFSQRQAGPVAPGERLDFFLVEEASPNRLLLSERDRHLDVLTCITTTPQGEGCELAITSSVRTHNRFGKLYMIPVGPAHGLIVRLMLARLQVSALQSPQAGATSEGEA